ncbi:hypothetical protein GGF43_000939 [Coemansia sp. RSA 2618]|nr:hypothetical protein GGF43_000939 [Coemansia sp. RSA 2618]
MVTDGEQFSDASFDQQSGNMAAELSGFGTDSQHEDNTEHLLSVNDTMSDIGRVVSQAEAGMDFTTNMDAPLDGVWTHRQQRPVGQAHVHDDISLSRFAESYWKPQHNDSDDVHSMV